MLAIFPPWWSAEDTVRAAAQAGVNIAGSSRMPGVLRVVADSDDALIALYDVGAWSLIATTRGGDCSLVDLVDRTQGKRP
jgi:hypothetical protein